MAANWGAAIGEATKVAVTEQNTAPAATHLWMNVMCIDPILDSAALPKSLSLEYTMSGIPTVGNVTPHP